jgi:hypothetical protein
MNQLPHNRADNDLPVFAFFFQPLIKSDLKDFVSETLKQLIEGVQDAHSIAKQHNAEVNPTLWGETKDLTALGLGKGPGHKTISVVEFDVSLTVVEGTGTKGGIGVVAGIFALGSQGQSKNENTSVSRVKFKVPISLPG